MDDFSHDYLIPDGITILEEIIDVLNTARDVYNHFDEYRQSGKLIPALTDKKVAWRQMIQLLPSSYNQRRTVFLNYETLCNIYWQRFNHKLDEWQDFCEWIDTLPEFELLKSDR